MGDGAPLLHIEQLEVVYHRVHTAIQGVSLRVGPGQIVALLGTNGAGKTTTLRAISGFVGLDDAQITGGRVLLDGAPIHGLAPHRAAALGVVLVPERDKVFESLSVQENLVVAMPAVSRAERRRRIDRACAYFPRLGELRFRQAGYLSGGERQMLALGAALCAGPRLLLIDELSLGLAPIMVENLLARVVSLRNDLGMAMLVVEQNAAAALSVADHGYVMENGRVVLDGSPERLRGHGDVQEFYLGRSDPSQRRSYRDVKQYRRSRRWYG